MTNYTVDFGRVQAVIADMDRIDGQIRTMLTELEESSRTSLAEWTSDAKEAYRMCKAKWDASASQMPVLLAQARNALPQIMDNYGRGDRAGCDMWNGTRVGR